MKSPYLSIVATSRNDNHGGQLLQRMQIFINGLFAQCARFSLPAELILVEWNPPADRPKLYEALNLPQTHSYCSIRIVEVPAALHNRLQYSDKLPLFQMIAKNVGIRRARSPFVLATNIDLLFSDRLIDFLSRRLLDEGFFYRADRYDVEADIDPESSIEEQLDYCEQYIIRINQRMGITNLQTGDYTEVYSLLHEIPWPQWMRSLFWQLHERLDRKSRLGKRLAHYLWMYTQHPRLHTNACGDFTLMSRDAWFRLRGYPELELFSWHLDSLLCFMAHYSGLKECILPEGMRAYHIEHAGGWTPEVERQGTLDRHLKRCGIRALTDEELEAYAVEMHRQRAPIVFNHDHWGFALENLPERTFGAAIG